MLKSRNKNLCLQGFPLRCPTLNELPPPPYGKVGWPWTTESEWLPVTQVNGCSWPCITIVTPSFNQGAFLEETIRSVLLQNYPNLEYIIIDGGSNDNSIDIINKYEKWLTYWISEEDQGQADGLRKGFNKADGDLFGWINSDDLLASSALQKVADAYIRNPLFDIYIGRVENFEDGRFGEGHEIIIQRNISTTNLIMQMDKRKIGIYHQPGIFFTSNIYRKTNGINPDYYFRMDYDLLLQMLEREGGVYYITENLAYFRKYPQSKTGTIQKHLWINLKEKYQIESKYLTKLSREDRLRLQKNYLRNLWYGIYIDLKNMYLRSAIGCLTLIVKIGRLSTYSSLFKFISKGIYKRIK